MTITSQILCNSPSGKFSSMKQSQTCADETKDKSVEDRWGSVVHYLSSIVHPSHGLWKLYVDGVTMKS